MSKTERKKTQSKLGTIKLAGSLYGVNIYSLDKFPKGMLGVVDRKNKIKAVDVSDLIKE